MNTHSPTIPGRKSHNRTPLFICCVVIIVVVLTCVLWNTHETQDVSESDTPVSLLKRGLDYYYGKNVTVDKAKGERLVRKAIARGVEKVVAQKGDAVSQFYIGKCYHEGFGVTKNIAKAVKWYSLAAEKGEMRAQNNLGGCYYYGYGVNKDYAEAAQWLRKAAEQGLALAQSDLGICYAHGYGVPRDLSEAAEWYRKAAEQGYAPAQYNLGFCYAKGNGVDRDHTEAVKWFRKAAKQGDKDAQYILGLCYEYGDGVSKDMTEALKWYRLAAKQGNERAKAALTSCGKMKQIDKEFSEAFQDMKKSLTAWGARSDVRKMRMIWVEKMLHLSGCALCRASLGNDAESKIEAADKQMQTALKQLEGASDPQQTYETIGEIAKTAALLIPLF